MVEVERTEADELQLDPYWEFKSVGRPIYARNLGYCLIICLQDLAGMLPGKGAGGPRSAAANRVK